MNNIIIRILSEVMARPPNPIGKDRPRTICLDGDVAEIAQRLASNNLLSREISQFLRNKYGHSSELEKQEARLHEIVNERKQLQELEEEMITKIDELKQSELNKAIEEKAKAQEVALKDIEFLEGKISSIEARLKYGIADEERRKEAIKDLDRHQKALDKLRDLF